MGLLVVSIEFTGFTLLPVGADAQSTLNENIRV